MKKIENEFKEAKNETKRNNQAGDLDVGIAVLAVFRGHSSGPGGNRLGKLMAERPGLIFMER